MKIPRDFGFLPMLVTILAFTGAIESAQAFKDGEVLTGSALESRFEKIEKAQLELVSRSEFADLIKRVAALEKLSERDMVATDASWRYRFNELERKVSGVQKQVTVLHAKKADK